MNPPPVIFGKHPAWPDFMEDGLPATGPLRQWCDAMMAALERTVTAGRWGAPGQPAPDWLLDFDHVLVWAGGGAGPNQLAVGRIWSSVDARGRSLYPLIVMQPLDAEAGIDDLRIALDHIERLGNAVRVVTDQDAFTRIRQAETERARLIAPQRRDRAAQWQELTAHAVGPAGDALLKDVIVRALVEFEETEVIASSPPPTASQSAAMPSMAFALRLEAAGDPLNRVGSLALLLRDGLRANNQLACLTPCSGGGNAGGDAGGVGAWVDVIVGLPAAESVQAMREDAAAAPIRREAVPELGPMARAVLACWRAGQRLTPVQPAGGSGAAKAGAGGSGGGRSGAASRKVRTIAVVVGGIVLAAIVLLILLLRG